MQFSELKFLGIQNLWFQPKVFWVQRGKQIVSKQVEQCKGDMKVLKMEPNNQAFLTKQNRNIPNNNIWPTNLQPNQTHPPSRPLKSIKCPPEKFAGIPIQ